MYTLHIAYPYILMKKSQFCGAKIVFFFIKEELHVKKCSGRGKTIFFFIGTSATKSWKKSRISRYGLHQDFLSRGQKNTGEGLRDLDRGIYDMMPQYTTKRCCRKLFEFSTRPLASLDCFCFINGYNCYNRYRSTSIWFCKKEKKWNRLYHSTYIRCLLRKCWARIKDNRFFREKDILCVIVLLLIKCLEQIK